MKPKHSIASRLALPSVIIITALGFSAAHAATFIWDGGGGDANWSTAANWNPDGAPTDSSASNLVFTGTATQLTSTNTADDFNIGTITFDSTAASYNITSDTSREILLNSGSAIIQNSNNAQTFTLAGSLGTDPGNSTVTGAGTGLVTFSGGTIGNRSSSGDRTLAISNGPFDVLITSTIQNTLPNGNKLLVLTKSNTGTLTLQGNGTYTGGTSVNGGKLVLDYNTITTGNRLSDTAAVGVNGGDLRLLGDTAAATAETVGPFNVNTTGGKLTLIPGTGQSATFTAASLNRTATSGSILFRGTNLGGNSGEFSQILFAGANGLLGGAGAAGTPQLSIIPFAFGDTSATGTGTALVTYDGTVGVRLLNEATEYAGYASANTSDNAKFTTSGTVTAAATLPSTGTSTTINSLLLRNSSGSAMTVTIDDGVNLAPVSGTFLFRGDSAADTITLTKNGVSGTGTINLAANTSANAFVTADTTATIDAPISLNTTGSLVKDGGGTLILNQVTTNTGFAAGTMPVIAVNSGTLKAGAANIVATPNSGGSDYITAMTIANGAIFDLNGFDQAFVNRGRLNTSFGSIITNTSATNATLTPNGPTSLSGGALSSGKTITLDGTITDGNGAADGGLVSLNFVSASSSTGNNLLAISHGGQTLNNFNIQATGSDKATANLTTLTPTDHNTIHGSVTLRTRSSNTNGFVTINANAVSNGTVASKPLGDAPITFTNDNSGNSATSTGVLNIAISASSGTLDGTTSTWLNDVVVTGGNSGTNYNATDINLDRGDGVSTNFTHRMDELKFTGITRKLDVTASNGTTLEFTGTTTFDHNANTTETIQVVAGTLKLNNIVQTGTGNKGLTKSGAGSLVINGTASYAGATSVTNGTFKLGASGTIANTSGISVSSGANFDVTSLASPFSLAAGKTLSGAGTVAGAAEVLGTVAPTAVPSGTLTTTNNLTVPGTLDIDFDAVGVAQVETSTAVGTVDADGGDIVNVTVTGADISGSPLTIPVTVTAGDLPAAWAGTVRSALSGNAAITAFYTVGGSGAAITLTRNSGVANDGTLNIALDNDVTLNPGITAAPTSTNSTAGVAKSNDLLVVGGALTLTSGTLDVSVVGSLTAPAYIIAKYDSLVGTFASEGTLPSGYTLNYAYNDGFNTKNIALVQTGGGNPYTIWSGGAGFYADANNDGVPNGLAWILGAGSPTANALGFLPTPVQSGGNLTMTFTQVTPMAPAKLFVEYSNDLGISDPWHSVEVPTAIGTSTVSDVSFSITAGSPTTSNNVSLTVPASKAAGGKLFSRLRSAE